MSENELWILPDGVKELENALSLEQLRRDILDLFHKFGYELVLPPLLEFLNTLLIGKGSQLELETIKITDQASGKLMGLRADITPQIARIAAQSNRSRFCYVGDVAKARNVADNRIPMQIGAELFGFSGLSSDIEIINLMLKVLATADIKNVYLDLGHVGIFRALVSKANFNQSQELALLGAIQRKSKQDTNALLKEFDTEKDLAGMILSLIELHGDKEILTKAAQELDTNIVGNTLTELEKLADIHPNIHFDLSELRGYNYHTGLIFSAFVEQSSIAIAKGGRYNNVGKIFGKDQPATGFSADLFNLVKIADYRKSFETIFAPFNNDQNLSDKISQLRDEGKAVIQELPDEAIRKQQQNCTHQLVKKSGIWRVVIL